MAKTIILVATLCFAVATNAQKGIKNCMCAAEWAPVCGEDGQTYSNACEARCAKVTNFINRENI